MLTVDARARPPARASGAPPQPTLRLVWCLEGPKPKLHLSLADSVWLRLVLRIRFAAFLLFSRSNPGWILRKWPFGHCCFGPRGLWLLPFCFVFTALRGRWWWRVPGSSVHLPVQVNTPRQLAQKRFFQSGTALHNVEVLLHPFLCSAPQSPELRRVCECRNPVRQSLVKEIPIICEEKTFTAKTETNSSCLKRRSRQRSLVLKRLLVELEFFLCILFGFGWAAGRTYALHHLRYKFSTRRIRNNSNIASARVLPQSLRMADSSPSHLAPAARAVKGHVQKKFGSSDALLIRFHMQVCRMSHTWTSYVKDMSCVRLCFVLRAFRTGSHSPPCRKVCKTQRFHKHFVLVRTGSRCVRTGFALVRSGLGQRDYVGKPIENSEVMFCLAPRVRTAFALVRTRRHAAKCWKTYAKEHNLLTHPV